MKNLASLAISGCLIVAGILSATAQESAPTEIIRHTSPDKKFAMRILCDSAPEDPKNIDAGIVKAVDIVSLPRKEVVVSLSGGEYNGVQLVWASDSKWCAFYYMSGPRVGDTSVYHLESDKFVLLETEGMSVDVKGDTRNQYIEPVRWVKPGTLLLKQYTIFRGDAGDSTVRFTVRFDNDGKFHIISKKKERSKD